jgi:hypothetical protein
VIASGLVSAALASTMFFSLSPSASRAEVLRYVVIGLVPMSALGPLLGPLLDRRLGDAARLIAGSNGCRAACCIALAATLHTPAFFVLALALLVANKGYSVGRQAALPVLVGDGESLVGANAAMARLGAVAGIVATGAGVGLAALTGAHWILLAAAVIFAVAARRGAAIGTTPARPRRSTLPRRVRIDPRARAAGISYALVRAAVAVWALGMAFALRRADLGLAALGVLAAGYSAGSLVGNLSIGTLTRDRDEVHVIATAALGAAVAAGLAATTPTAVGLVVSAFVLGVASTGGRLAFDAVVQATSAPDGRGRTYARLETGVQLAWAAGAAAVVSARLGTQAISLTLVALLVPAALVAVCCSPVARAAVRRRLVAPVAASIPRRPVPVPVVLRVDRRGADPIVDRFRGALDDLHNRAGDPAGWSARR